MPFLSSETASSTTITAATVRALRSSHPRTEPSRRVAQSRATSSSTIATSSGSRDTSEKKSQSTMYCVALG